MYAFDELSLTSDQEPPPANFLNMDNDSYLDYKYHFQEPNNLISITNDLDEHHLKPPIAPSNKKRVQFDLENSSENEDDELQ